MAARRLRGALAPAPILLWLLAGGCVQHTSPEVAVPAPAPAAAPSSVLLAAPREAAARTASAQSLEAACGGFGATVPALKPVFGVNVGPQGDPQVACFLWQSFIGLSWPALAGSPGQRHPNAAFGSGSPVVWETYKSPDEVFLPGAATPAPWGQSAVEGAVPTPLRALRATRGLRMLRSASMTDVAHLSVFKRDLSSTTQVDDNTLVDQARQPVYYEMALNRDEFEYIVQNKLYDGKQQVTLASSSFIELPMGKTSYGPVGSIELKAAWKVLTAAEASAVPLRFHTMSALLGSSTTPVTVGLVGLHVVQRVPGFDQGLWATFAQIDNCPTARTAAGGSYSFNNAACTTCTPNEAINPQTNPLTPTQVQQVNVVPSSIAAVNTAMKTLLEGTTWQYYQLLGVQWPSSPIPMKKGVTTPLATGSPNIPTLINPVLETFLQKPNTSCLGCHRSASTANVGSLPASYSFLFDHAQ